MRCESNFVSLEHSGAINNQECRFEPLILRVQGLINCSRGPGNDALIASRPRDTYHTYTLSTMVSPESPKLTLYVDCGLSTSQPPAPSYLLTISLVSPYSWFAFINCTHHREQLKQHGIVVDIVPFFLGGARNGNGHPYQDPPPVKAVWGDRDVQTVASLLGLKTQRPKIFPIISLYVPHPPTHMHCSLPALLDSG